MAGYGKIEVIVWLFIAAITFLNNDVEAQGKCLKENTLYEHVCFLWIPLFSNMHCLPLNWLRYCTLPLVVKGVPMDPNSENAFSKGVVGPNSVHSKTTLEQ